MKKLFKHWVVAPAFAAACWGTVGAIGAEVNSPAQVLKHATTDGQTFCAVMLKANDLPKGVVSRNHIILIDTSASQVGEHRQFGLSVVQSLLDSLPETDQVRLFAVDLGAEALGADFTSPRSDSVRNALKTLKSRVPLGATNLQSGLEAALKASVSGQATDIAYIGDGMSTADLIESVELRNLLGSLRTRQIPVHGVGVGPKINGQLLGILAHQTGGSLTLDLNSEFNADGSKLDVNQAATKQGISLATAMKKPVFFPSKLDVSTAGTELLPNQPLPIRTDRETIYVARGAFPAQAKIVMSDADGQSMEWSLAAAITKPEHGFLPEFVQQVAADGGLSNPLAGASMLVVAQDQFKNRVDSLAQQGATALAKRDVKQARHLADLALQADPNNEFAQALGTATKKFQIRTVSQQEADAAPAASDLENKVAPDPNASTLDEQQRSITVKTEKLRNQVSSAIENSRRSVDPDSGIGQLKQALNAVRSAIDVAPEDRLQLQKRLDSEIQIQVNQREQKVAAVSQALQQRAQQESKQRLAEQFILEEERLETYIDRVRSLMNEGRHGRDSAYGEAQIVADYAIDLRPGDGTAMAARFTSEAAEQLLRSYRLRNRRADLWLETLHQVELSHVPFPDEPPIRFPAAEVWRQLTERRKKWATVDLKRNSPNEQRIQRALSDSTEVAFTDNTLEEAMNFLEELHNIEIWIDKKALENGGEATPETPVTLSMSGVSLRSVLRLILEPLKLTYIIEDEVMKITTVEEAEAKMSTRVYPVADLVVPPQAGGGGFGGQGGQQGGQQGGFGGGGQGGGGFGGGGGGFGGGGGGGFFNVPQEELGKAAPDQRQPVQGRNVQNRDDLAVEVLKKKLRASR